MNSQLVKLAYLAGYAKGRDELQKQALDDAGGVTSSQSDNSAGIMAALGSFVDELKATGGKALGWLKANKKPAGGIAAGSALATATALASINYARKKQKKQQLEAEIARLGV